MIFVFSISLPDFFAMRVAVFILLTCISLQIRSQNFLTYGTPQTIDKNHFQYGVFHSLGYGLTNTLEIGAQHTFFPVVPNLYLKKNWEGLRITKQKSSPWLIASRFGMHYPTIGLKLLSNMGIKPFLYNPGSLTFLDSSAHIPSIIAFSVENMIGRFLQKPSECAKTDFNNLLTLKIGLQYAKNADTIAVDPIAFPILYPRTNIYDEEWLAYIGLAFDRDMSWLFSIKTDVTFYAIEIPMVDFALEHKAIAYFHLMRKNKVGRNTYNNSKPRRIVDRHIAVGYKLSYGSYPFLPTKFRIFPIVDFVWQLEVIKKHKKGRSDYLID